MKLSPERLIKRTDLDIAALYTTVTNVGGRVEKSGMIVIAENDTLSLMGNNSVIAEYVLQEGPDGPQWQTQSIRRPVGMSGFFGPYEEYTGDERVRVARSLAYLARKAIAQTAS